MCTGAFFGEPPSAYALTFDILVMMCKDGICMWKLVAETKVTWFIPEAFLWFVSTVVNQYFAVFIVISLNSVADKGRYQRHIPHSVTYK